MSLGKLLMHGDMAAVPGCMPATSSDMPAGAGKLGPTWLLGDASALQLTDAAPMLWSRLTCTVVLVHGDHHRSAGTLDPERTGARAGAL